MAKGDFVYRNYQDAMAAPSASVWKNAVLPAALSFGGGGLLGMLGKAAPAAGSSFGIGAANTGSWATGVGAAPAMAASKGLGGILSNPLVGLGVNAFTSLMGNRSNNRANRDSLNAQLSMNNQATQLQQRSMDEQIRQFNAQQEDQRAALAAENEFRRRELAASEEERAYTRGERERREAYLQPYREMSLGAARSLAAMLRG